MITRRNKPSRGICFAWHPVRVKGGWVWLEFVHFNWVEGWGWGSDGNWSYRRFVSRARYDAGERAQ